MVLIRLVGTRNLLRLRQPYLVQIPNRIFVSVAIEVRLVDERSSRSIALVSTKAVRNVTFVTQPTMARYET